MAQHRDSSPLFEIIRPTNEQSARRGMRLPAWMRRKAEDTAEPADAAPETTVEDDAQDGALSDLLAWFKDPVALRLPRATLIGAGVAVIVVIIFAYLTGERAGRRAEQQAARAYQSLQGPLESLREGPVTVDLPSSVTGVQSDADSYPSAGEGLTGPEAREVGLNYFRLTVLPADAESEAMRIVDFLSTNGLDAAIVPIKNGRSLKIVVLRGFTRPVTDPRAKALRERLLRLGREWKQEHDGSSDWNDLYAEKYQRGLN